VILTKHVEVRISGSHVETILAGPGEIEPLWDDTDRERSAPWTST
jgi:hypothetical protein